MKMNYILGRTSRGKSYELMKCIARDIEDEKVERVILIVPEQYTLHAEYELINKMDLSGLIKAEVLSFKRLSHRLISNGKAERSHIDEIGKYMLLNKVIDSKSKELKVFKQGSKKGVLSELLSLLNHFKQSNIYSGDIESKIKGIEEESLFKSKLEDLVLIYESFEEEMEGLYIDDRDLINIAKDEIQNSQFLDGTNIYLDGFNSFSAQEYEMIAELLKKSNSLSIALTNSDFGRDYDLFSPVNETLFSLRRIEEEAGAESETVKLQKLLEKSEEIGHIESELYSYPYSRWEGKPEDIAVVSGLNRNSEVENVARDILSLARDSNMRWRDILVVSSNMDIYQSIFKRVFSEYGIPYFLDETRDITGHSLIRYVISTITSIVRNFRYDDVFKSLKTGFGVLDEEEVELLENYVLEFGVRGEKWFVPFEKTVDNIDELERIRKKYIESVEMLKESLSKKSCVRDINKAIFDHLVDISSKEKIDSLIEEQKSYNRLDMANESAQIWNILMDVLDQMNSILGEKSSTAKDYVKNLEAGLMNYELGIIPPSLDQVMIGNLERSRTRDIRAIFIIGVNDGILPSIISDSGILNDEERVGIVELGLDIKLDSEKKIQDEKFLIYSCMTKPKEKLFLSYALSDNEGKALRPSTIIDRIKTLFPDIEVESDLELRENSEIKLLGTPVSTLKHLVGELRNYIDGLDISENWLEIYSWYRDSEEYRDTTDGILESLFYTNQQDYIKDGHAKSIYPMPLKTSISRLERFIRCPFSHFVNYGLGPKERKRCEVKTPDIGNLFHKTIENYSEALDRLGLKWSEVEKEKSDGIVDDIIDGMVDEFQNGIFTSSNRYRYLVKKLKRVSRRAVRMASEHLEMGEFNPLSYEISFGERDSDNIPPIVIELPGGEQLILEGRIDRVDIAEGKDKSYVKVIDYKSGNREFSLSDAFYGLQIQLIVYLDAILQNSSHIVKNELYPAGAFYFKIKDPMINTEEESSEEIEKAISKELKMNGMVLKDIDVIKLMDRNIEIDSKSDVVPVRVKKDGNFYSDSPVFELEEFRDIIDHIHNLIGEIGQEMIKGKVKIEPCKSGDNISCRFCEFDSICQFDVANEDNEYKQIKKLDKDRVMENIRMKKGENRDE